MYKKGIDFPHQGFVQNALDSYFDKKGYIKEQSSYTDYAGIHIETGERWRVEPKGLTGNMGLDFRKGIGQLIQRMDDPNVHYGIAIPNIPQFLRQVRQIKGWVRDKLVINDDGCVQHILPEPSLNME